MDHGENSRMLAMQLSSMGHVGNLRSQGSSEGSSSGGGESSGAGMNFHNDSTHVFDIGRDPNQTNIVSSFEALLTNSGFFDVINPFRGIEQIFSAMGISVISSSVSSLFNISPLAGSFPTPGAGLGLGSKGGGGGH